MTTAEPVDLEVRAANITSIVLHYEMMGLHDTGGVDAIQATEVADMPFVLVESGRDGFYLTPCQSPEDGENVALGNEEPLDWDPTCLIDTDTRRIYEPVESLSWRATEQYIPEPPEGVTLASLTSSVPVFVFTEADVRELISGEGEATDSLDRMGEAIGRFRQAVMLTISRMVLEDAESLPAPSPASGEDPIPPSPDGDPGPPGPTTAASGPSDGTPLPSVGP